MFKKLRQISKEEFDTGEYGICAEIYVERKFDWARAVAIGVVLIAMLLTFWVIIEIQ